MFKSFYLLLETDTGLEQTRKGDLIPEFGILYQDSIQEKWARISDKWLRLWHMYTKGKKNMVSLNIEFCKFVYKNLAKAKLIKNFQANRGFSGQPCLFKRIYGYEVTSYFPVSILLEKIYILLNLCSFCRTSV